MPCGAFTRHFTPTCLPPGSPHSRVAPCPPPIFRCRSSCTRSRTATPSPDDPLGSNDWVAVDGQTLTLDAAGEFTLPHAAARQLPDRIGAVHNEDNAEGEGALKADSTLPALQAALHVDLARNALDLQIKNVSQESLGPLHLTFRLPLKWKRGVVKGDLASLKSGEIRKIPLTLGDVETDARYDAGTYYFAVQCDYAAAAGAARLHTSASVAAQTCPIE